MITCDLQSNGSCSTYPKGKWPREKGSLCVQLTVTCLQVTKPQSRHLCYNIQVTWPKSVNVFSFSESESSQVVVLWVPEAKPSPVTDSDKLRLQVWVIPPCCTLGPWSSAQSCDWQWQTPPASLWKNSSSEQTSVGSVVPLLHHCWLYGLQNNQIGGSSFNFSNKHV